MLERFLQLDRLLEQRQWAEAQALQADINAIIATLCSARGHMYAVAKAVRPKFARRWRPTFPRLWAFTSVSI